MNKQSPGLQNANQTFLHAFEEVMSYLDNTLAVSTPGEGLVVLDMMKTVEDDKKIFDARITQKNFQQIDQSLTTSAEAIKTKNLGSDGLPCIDTQTLDKYLTARNNYYTQAASANLDTSLQAGHSPLPDDQAGKNASSQAGIQVSGVEPTPPPQQPAVAAQSQTPPSTPSAVAPAAATAAVPTSGKPGQAVAKVPGIVAMQKFAAAQAALSEADKTLLAAFQGHAIYHALDTALETMDTKLHQTLANKPGDDKLHAQLDENYTTLVAALPKDHTSVTRAQDAAVKNYLTAQSSVLDTYTAMNGATLYPNAVDEAKNFSYADPKDKKAARIIGGRGAGQAPPGTDPLDHLENLKDKKEIDWTNGKGEKKRVNVDGDNASSNDPEALAKYAAAKGYTEFEIQFGKPDDVLHTMIAMRNEGIPKVTLSASVKADMDARAAADPEFAAAYKDLTDSFAASSKAYNQANAAKAPVSQAAIGGAFAPQVQNIATATTTPTPSAPPLVSSPPPTTTPDASAPPISEASPRTQKEIMGDTTASVVPPTPPTTPTSLAAASILPPVAPVKDAAQDVASTPSAAAATATATSAPQSPPPTIVTPGYNDPDTLQKKAAAATTPTMAGPPSLVTSVSAPTPPVSQPTIVSAAERFAKPEAADAAQKGTDKVSSPTTAPAAKATEKKAFGMEKISELAGMMNSGKVKEFVQALVAKIESMNPGDSSKLYAAAEKGFDKAENKITQDIAKIESKIENIESKIKGYSDKVGVNKARLEELAAKPATPGTPDYTKNQAEKKKLEKEQQGLNDKIQPLKTEMARLEKRKDDLTTDKGNIQLQRSELQDVAANKQRQAPSAQKA